MVLSDLQWAHNSTLLPSLTLLNQNLYKHELRDPTPIVQRQHAPTKHHGCYNHPYGAKIREQLNILVHINDVY